jgi:hypothetical protein
MKKGGTGGAHTAREGSSFEIKTDEELMSELGAMGYVESKLHMLSGIGGPIHGRTLVNKSNRQIDVFYKSGIYKLFFEPRGINYKEYFSARLEPDTSIFSSQTKTLTIIEKKQMTTAGSVAEKLQTCDYKRHYYETLLKGQGIKLDIFWVLGSYFKAQERQLKSVYDYMESKGSKYFFESMPAHELKI